MMFILWLSASRFDHYNLTANGAVSSAYRLRWKSGLVIIIRTKKCKLTNDKFSCSFELCNTN